jgi:hypothetical protein
MSPNGHDMSIGLWIISGVLRFGNGHGHTDMETDWETIAPQHESSCFAWSLEFFFWDYATQHCALRSHEIVFLEVVFFNIASPQLFLVSRALQASRKVHVLHSYRIMSLQTIHAVPTLIAILSSPIRPSSQLRPL